MKIYTVKIHYPKGIKESKIPSSDFSIIQGLYSIFGLKVELIEEEEYVMPIAEIKRRKKK